MSDSEQPPPDKTARGGILGRIPRGPADSRMQQPAQAPEPQQPLPRGAWLRLYASGGLVFRTSELVVFNDGRLTYKQSASPGVGQTLLVRQLTDAQIDELRHTIEAIDFAALVARDAGRQGSDRFAYELTVRAGRKTYTVEALQGAVPPPLAQLIRQLGQLVRVAAEETEV
ncbi:MAG: protealysin inhibitor emfourin [Roseiflexaceae bacterium]